MERNCDRRGTLRCSYVDRRNHACNTSWCAVHQKLIHGHPYCRRHASVAVALAATGLPTAQPDLDNRACSLASWMQARLDHPAVTVLERLAREERGTSLVRTMRLISGPGGRQRRWSSTWRLVDQRGVRTALSVEVAEDRDDEVVARVGTEVVGHGVPPWIERRRLGHAAPEHLEAEERRAFCDAIARSLELVATRRETRYR